jgi:hypothetical protein
VESWDPGYRQILQSPEDRDKVNNLVRMSIKFVTGIIYDFFLEY